MFIASTAVTRTFEIERWEMYDVRNGHFKDLEEHIKSRKNLIRLNIEQNDLHPSLTIVSIGDDSASESYMRGKIKDCEELGIDWKRIVLPTATAQSVLNKLLANESKRCSGLILQHPIPDNLDFDEAVSNIAKEADVDGLHSDEFHPCTAQGIMTYLLKSQYDFDGKNVLVIGRGKMAGYPIMKMLMDNTNASVTMVNSHTNPDFTREQIGRSDLVICATGNPQSIMLWDFEIKEGCDFIDVGLGRYQDGKLHGDLHEISIDSIIKNHGDVISGTGGVGLLTRMQLMYNVVTAEEIRQDEIKLRFEPEFDYLL